MLQAAQRGKAAQSTTQAEEDDPLKDRYGDAQLVQSRQQTVRVWTGITACSPEEDGKEVWLWPAVIPAQMRSLPSTLQHVYKTHIMAADFALS